MRTGVGLELSNNANEAQTLFEGVSTRLMI